jgi:hypothetical protein
MARTKKKPSLFSAADVARAVSGRLRRAGLVMADCRDRFRWTEGLYVHRVGCSEFVVIGYHRTRWPNDQEARQRHLDGMTKAREVLESAGYVLDETMRITCERP